MQGVEIVGPERVLLCEGTLLRVRARSDPKDYLFFLFNDALIYAEPVQQTPNIWSIYGHNTQDMINIWSKYPTFGQYTCLGFRA